MRKHCGHLALISILLFLLADIPGNAQTIQGQIIDVSTGKALEDVTIQNVHTENGIISDDNGKFVLTADKGQLIEFRKIGYKIIRVRLPQSALPPFFKVVMERGAIELQVVEVGGTGRENVGAAKDYKTDSLKYYQLYKRELEFPQLTGMDVVRHPFSAMSKRNQQIWAFQREYEWFQQQKYIDYTFNEKVISAVTGLRGDSAKAYIQLFRPTYAQLRSMNEYTYYSYIKRTVEAYRERGQRARMGRSRSSQ